MKKTHPKIFIADPIHRCGIEFLEKNGFEVIETSGLSNSELIKFISFFNPLKKLIPKSTLVVRTIRDLKSADIKKIATLTDIRLICAASSGYDNIDIRTASKYRIKVMNVPDGTSVAAVEHTIALILNLLKNINSADQDMKKGTFNFSRFSNTELEGKSIGIIGIGRVGSRVAKIARAFGMKVFANDIDISLVRKFPWVSFLSLQKLLSTSEIVTVHTPLDRSTRNIINSKNIKLLHPGSVIINCARGGIVNEKSLIKALKTGQVQYAGLDVFTNEPEFDKSLRGLKNVILTPHLAGKTLESKQKVSDQLARRIVDFYAGKDNTIRINRLKNL